MGVRGRTNIPYEGKIQQPYVKKSANMSDEAELLFPCKTGCSTMKESFQMFHRQVSAKGYIYILLYFTDVDGHL